MRLAFIGGVVGRRGREVVQENLPRLKDRLGLDFVVLNGENAAGGFGITPRIAAEFHEAGVDCITTGNHVWDQREIFAYLEADRRILRPANFPEGTPGRGAAILPAPGGRSEERRVGKEGGSPRRSRWPREHQTKKPTT